MSNLYVYDFGDEQYMVDGSGGRYTPVAFMQPDTKTVVCESCHTEVTEAIEDEHGHISCFSCFDVTTIDLTESADEILLDNGLGDYSVIPTLNYSGMEVTERHEDGYVIMNQVGSLSMWREITLSGTIYGYSYEGMVDDPEDDDLDRFAHNLPIGHSVTCHCCGQIADERETFPLTDDCASGEICPECHTLMQKEIDGANRELHDFISSAAPSEADVIRELACRLVRRNSLYTIVADMGEAGGDRTEIEVIGKPVEPEVTACDDKPRIFRYDPKTRKRAGG